MSKKKHNWRFIDLTGKVISRLTIIKELYTEGTRIYWLAKCSCDGKEIIVCGQDVHSGHTKSCGCLKKELEKKRSFKHGFKVGTPLQRKFYQAWSNLKRRCYDISNQDYHNYGGRGIKVCERWLDREHGFENFRDDMWESFLLHIEIFGIKNTSLDRFPNVNGNYESPNCRWNTNSQQGRHKRDSSNTENFVEHVRQRTIFGCKLNEYIRENIDSPLFKKLFGCTLLEFRKHIESQWLTNMTWNNRGANKKGKKVWQLDHITGCNNFDLSKEEDRVSCYHWSNFQPKWWEDHSKKSKLLVNFRSL